MKRHKEIILAVIIVMVLVLFGIALGNPVPTNGPSEEKKTLAEQNKRDPFLLPPGVYLLSKIHTSPGDKRILSKGDGKPNETLPSFKVKAILISDHVRLASIDHHIVSVGDSIHDEKILEIKTDRVILGKGDQKRTLLLSQSPVQLIVEEKKGDKK